MASILKGQSGQPIQFETTPNVNGDDVVLDSYVGGQTLASGTATFTNSTNNINAVGIGIGVEVGDVIQISGATNAKNNSEFTVEVITDDNNVIVNQAHAGGTTSKSLVDETATVTIKLLCKWYLAPIGLGQGWVDVISERAGGVAYMGLKNRAIIACVTYGNASTTNANRSALTVDGITTTYGTSRVGIIDVAKNVMEKIVPLGGIEYVASSLGYANLNDWEELR